MKLKKITFISAVILLFCLSASPQSLLAQNVISRYGPDTRFVLSGEGTFTTYGAGITFPVFWIEERVKMIPLFGLMWQNFADDGFELRPAAGAKFLYYFQKQPFGFAPKNSFYAGLGGMGTINNFVADADDEYSRAGAIVGYNFILNETVQLAPELLLGANQVGNFRAEIGFVLHFGR